MSESPFITYPELYKILHDKYQATDDEVKYWVNSSRSVVKYYGFCMKQLPHDSTFILPYEHDTTFILPYESDLPNCSDMYVYSNASPEYSFYYSHIAKLYTPSPHHRFVYVRDLAGKRNWLGHLRSDTNLYSDFPALDEAARAGLLRFYDETKKEFTYKKHFKLGDQESDVLWIDTKEGQDYLSDPSKFFLLQDIINIERLFFNRPREDCLKELGREE